MVIPSFSVMRAQVATWTLLSALAIFCSGATAFAQYSQGEPLFPPGSGTLKVSSGDPHYLLVLGPEGLSTSMDVTVALYLDESCTVTINGVLYRGRVKRDAASGELGCEVTRDTDNRLPQGLSMFVSSDGKYAIARDTESGRVLLVFSTWGHSIDHMLMEFWESMERLGIIF